MTLYFSIILVLNVITLYICVITQFIRGLRTDQVIKESIIDSNKMLKADLDSALDTINTKITDLNDFMIDNRTKTDLMKSKLDSTLGTLKDLEKNYYTNFMNNRIFTIDYDYDKLSKGPGPYFYQYTVPEIKKMISYDLYFPHMLYTQTNIEVLKELLSTGLNIDENLVSNYKGKDLGQNYFNGQPTNVTPLVYTFKRDVVLDYDDVNGCRKVRYTGTNYNVIKFFIKQGANTDIEVTDIDGRSKIKLVDHPAMLIPEMILLIDSMKSK